MDNQAVMLMEEHIMRARCMLENGTLTRAFDMYLEAINLYPDSKEILEVEFRRLLSHINETLVESERVGDIFSNFERATVAYPDNIFILNEIGKYLHKYNFHVEACCYFQKAIRFQPGYVAPEKNLNSVKNFLIERWHYRMLNDKVRNDAFKSAIQQTMNAKEFVLDLGSGTGLLSLYAGECRPLEIIACDASEVMIDICKNVVQENTKDGIIVTVPKLSTELNHIDIACKRSLIITELFDAGLFGEHVLETISHAWENLLAPTGRVIPGKAEFFIVGAQCDFLNLNYRLSPPAKEILNITDAVHVLSTEPYDCDDVHLFSEIEYLTKPQLLFQVDFNDANDVNQILECSEPYEVTFNAKKPGELNAIIGWFNLHLTTDIMLTTDPSSEVRANAWQQAIFYDFIPKTLDEDDTLTARFSTAQGKLSLISNSTDEVSRVSPEMIRFLNDADYMQMITSSAGSICTYLSQIDEISCQSIVDLLPFPVFGLLMLRFGAQYLICYAKTEKDKHFIKKVFKANKIPQTKFTILVDKELKPGAFTNLKFHAVFMDYIDLCGELNVIQKNIASMLTKYHLLQHGLLLPHKLELHGQLISSNWLRITNRLFDENVHNYKIAEYINKYQVSQNVNIDIKHLEYEELSEAVMITELNRDTEPVLINAMLTKNGHANAILCWYVIQLMENEMSITTRRGNSSVDTMAFLAYPEMETTVDQSAGILYCVDADGAFKLIADID